MMKVLHYIILLYLSASIFGITTDLAYYIDKSHHHHQVLDSQQQNSAGTIEENHTQHPISEEIFSDSNHSVNNYSTHSIKIITIQSYFITNCYITTIWQPPKRA